MRNVWATFKRYFWRGRKKFIGKGEIATPDTLKSHLFWLNNFYKEEFSVELLRVLLHSFTPEVRANNLCLALDEAAWLISETSNNLQKSQLGTLFLPLIAELESEHKRIMQRAHQQGVRISQPAKALSDTEMSIFEALRSISIIQLWLEWATDWMNSLEPGLVPAQNYYKLKFNPTEEQFGAAYLALVSSLSAYFHNENELRSKVASMRDIGAEFDTFYTICLHMPNISGLIQPTNGLIRLINQLVAEHNQILSLRPAIDNEKLYLDSRPLLQIIAEAINLLDDISRNPIFQGTMPGQTDERVRSIGTHFKAWEYLLKAAEQFVAPTQTEGLWSDSLKVQILVENTIRQKPPLPAVLETLEEHASNESRARRTLVKDETLKITARGDDSTLFGDWEVTRLASQTEQVTAYSASAKINSEDSGKPSLVRIHSWCTLAQMGSIACDCAVQLEHAQEEIQDRLYLGEIAAGLIVLAGPEEHDGRGLGSSAYVKALDIERMFPAIRQDYTYASLGSEDARDFSVAAQVVRELKFIDRIIILGSNANKIQALREQSIDVIGYIPGKVSPEMGDVRMRKTGTNQSRYVGIHPATLAPPRWATTYRDGNAASPLS